MPQSLQGNALLDYVQRISEYERPLHIKYNAFLNPQDRPSEFLLTSRSLLSTMVFDRRQELATRLLQMFSELEARRVNALYRARHDHSFYDKPARWLAVIGKKSRDPAIAINALGRSKVVLTALDQVAFKPPSRMSEWSVGLLTACIQLGLMGVLCKLPTSSEVS